MLEIVELSKRYYGTTALDHVSFVVRPYELAGYLGPNGSGKSTTAKILAGLLQPSGGRVLYQGRDVSRNLDEYKQVLGYVPEEPYLYSYLTGAEYLELIGELRAIPRRKLREKIDQFLILFSLYGDRFTPLSSYSKGMRQKILIAAALLHNPEIIILDEPFSGLDVSSTMVLRKLIQALAASGKVVLYSSHVLEIVEKVCRRVVILHKGRVVADDSVERLRDLMKLPSLEDIFSQLALEQNLDQVAEGLMQVIQL
jgi:ABC-2 type transport system ATP-binding protein